MSRKFLSSLALGAAVIVLLLVIAIAYVSHQEQANTFCVSCHTEPEMTYLARYLRAAEQGTAEDLAAFHYRQNEIQCIDCHSGEGAWGRTQVLLYGARNAFKRYTGFMQQPAVIELPIQNEACLKCHDARVRQPGFENHMHNKQFLSTEPVPFIRCADCHVSHRPADERTVFLFRDAILPRCEFCHATVGGGPRGLTQ